MESRPSIRTSNSGFTVLELLVASTIGMIIMALALGSMLANRQVYHYDLVRTRLNQNLRGALDLVAANAREAGESVPGTFAAVEIVDGGAASDELILRRNLLDEVLKVCVDISAGSGTTQIVFANNSSTPGCTYADNTHNFNTWQEHRTSKGGNVRAYIYDTVTKQGEFFNYVTETDSGSSYSITRSAGSWANDYTVGAASVYMLEEWHFKVEDFALEDDLLQVIENEDTDNPMNVLSAVIDFFVTAQMMDGTVKSSFNPAAGDQWTEIKALEVTLRGEDKTIKGETIESTVSSRFFPRNILSN